MRGAVRVEGDTAIAVVNGRLTRIDLPSGHQVSVHIDGRWVGGPANRTIFVARGDGSMYAQRLDGGSPIRLTTRTFGTHFLTSTGKSAYFARDDGNIEVVDLDRLAANARLQTACRFIEGIRLTGNSALVHCDDAQSSSHLFAFTIHRPQR